MIARFAEWQGRERAFVATDATYGNGQFLQWLMERGITQYMRTRDSALRKNSPLYGPNRFTFFFPKATVIAVPQASNLPTAVAMLGTVPISPICTSGPANVVVRARKKRNASAHC
jgi:hypothetical protein